MSKLSRILLGFEVVTCKPVYVNPDHLIITGQTGMAGKTLTLNALNSRSGRRCIAFRTKRGEMEFDATNTLKPFYTEPKTQRSKYISWQYVKSILEASQGRGMNFEEAWIIRACDNSRTLREVYENIKRLQNEARKGIDENQYLKLTAYFDIILPQLEEREYSKTIKLKKGINLMDLEPLSFEMRCLVMERTITYVMTKMKNVVIMLPEGWKYVPEKLKTPVKSAAIGLAREGVSIQNHIWIDSMPHYETLLCRIDGVVHATTFGSLFTLEPSTFKETDKGETIKYFESVVEVPVFDGSRLNWGRVKYALEHDYDGELLRLNTVSGVIDVSPNHPIMKQPCYITEASTLEVGTRLVQRKFPKKRFKNNGNKILFIGTEELAWTYGFFGAEGWVNGKHTCIANSDHSKIIRASKAIETNFHYSPSISERGGIYTLDVASPVLNQHFRETMYLPNMKPSSRTKRVPPIILNARKNIQIAFINGYEDGDGHYNEIQEYVDAISSVSRALLLGLLYLKRTPILVHIRDDKPDNVQININKTNQRRKPRDKLKKIVNIPYKGKLYDIEVESKDHTFYMGIGNFRVHNSQDLRGVDKVLVGQCSTWLLGVQVEANEAKRTRTSLGDRVKVKDIQGLKLGHFYLRNKKNELIHVYVLPAGIPETMGKQVAKGEISPEVVRDYLMGKKLGDDEEMYRKKFEESIETIGRLEDELQELEDKTGDDVVDLGPDLEKEREKVSDLGLKISCLESEKDAMLNLFKDRGLQIDALNEKIGKMEKESKKTNNLVTAIEDYIQDTIGEAMKLAEAAKPAPSEPIDVSVSHELASIDVVHEIKRLEVSTEDLLGKVIWLYANDKFGDITFSQSHVYKLFKENGWSQDPRTKKVLVQLVQWGYFEAVQRGRRQDYRVKIKPKAAIERGLLKFSEKVIE